MIEVLFLTMKDDDFFRDWRRVMHSEHVPKFDLPDDEGDVLPMKKQPPPDPVRRSPWFGRLVLAAYVVVGVFGMGVLAGVFAWGYRVVTGAR